MKAPSKVAHLLVIFLSFCSLSIANVDASKKTQKIKIEGATFRQFRLLLSNKNDTKINTKENSFINEILQIINKDLEISAGFSLITLPKEQGYDSVILKKLGIEGISYINISLEANNDIKIILNHENLINLFKNRKEFKGKKESYRKLAHFASQSIFENFIAEENIFLSQIAAVKRNKNGSQIVLFDFDGKNEYALTNDSWIKSSPFFAPDGKSILYTVITPNGQAIIEQNIETKQRKLLSKKPGLNLDPRISKDNKYLFATLSFNGSAHIYRADRNGRNFEPISPSIAADLSPSLNEKEMAFVSTRSGTPQIYLMSLSDAAKPARRLTFKGNYNQTPIFNPKGNLIAFTGRDEFKAFDIYILDKESGNISRVTEKQGLNQEPFFSASGRFLGFSSERDSTHRSRIFLSTLDGSHQICVNDADGDYFSPVLRPIQR